MSVNRHEPHLLVLPEDDANRQFAVGFVLDARLDPRRIQILPSAGGWAAAREAIARDHLRALARWETRHLVVVVDFDADTARAEAVLQAVPASLRDRVAVLGVWTDAEDLRRSSAWTLEHWGVELAAACAEERDDLWQHDLLRHNQAELQRLAPSLRRLLFPSSQSG